MPKALLLPSYIGGGFGHISRCLALAAELRAQGWETAFMLGGQHAHRVSGLGHRVYTVGKSDRAASAGRKSPVFTVLADFSYQLVRDGLTHPRAIRASMAEQFRVVRQFRPDVIISDASPLANPLARLAGLPVVQIIRSIIHPAAPNLLWWRERPAGLVSPDPRPVFNPLLQSWGLSPVEKAEDLLRGDLYLVPSLPELDPLPNDLADTHYVGPLVRQQPDQVPEWILSLDCSRPVVYITAGGGADAVGGIAFYRTVIEALGDAGVDLQVIVSTGARVSPQDLPVPPQNIRLEVWVPGQAMIARSDLVVFSGGYGTMMEMVQAGVPGLVIPFHSEQESNARRLEAAGVARVLFPSLSNPETNWHHWAGGRFSTQTYWTNDLTPARVRAAVCSAVKAGELREGVRRLQAGLSAYGGAAQAVSLISDLLQTWSTPEGGWDRLSSWQKLLISCSQHLSI